MKREFDKIVNYAKELEVEPINKETGNFGDMYKVKEHTVRVFNKKGRKLMTCDCDNDSRNPNEPTICVHRVAVFNYIIFNDNIVEAKRLKEEYERFKKYGHITTETYEDYIDKLFRLIFK